MGLFLFYASAAFVYFMVDRFAVRKQKHYQLTASCPQPQISPTDIVLRGRDFELSDDDLHRILTRRFPYYLPLTAEVQKRFRRRLHNFIDHKTFIIKDDEGFKEMPVLVSAAAVQLTFGLTHYLLPFYPYIRIYPQEYFRDGSFSVLAGNVEGNIITVAWNHLLKGIENPTDGANVGLHEMSHALYFQKMVVEETFAKKFTKRYNYLLSESRTAFEDELKGRVDLYSDYANKDMQEFWAESVELFFEKPLALKRCYPAVYEKMTILMNQDPLNKQHPVIRKDLFSFY
ncbi:MAG TPA: zinc-dependent peptidase [Flavisolibacter sp.]|nr:zinc-dependent peptidase [Flavisolibacter sp.]